MTDVADDCLILHLRKVLEAEDVFVTGGGDVDIAPAEGIFDGEDAEAFHCSLKSADWIDFSDDDLGTLPAERLGAAFADITVSADNAYFTGDHYVGSALDAIDERLAAAVEVIKLTLSDGVVHVDCWHAKLFSSSHLVETVDTGGGFLGNTFPLLEHVGPLKWVFSVDLLKEFFDDSFFLGLGRCIDP